MEIKIEYLYPIPIPNTYNLVLNVAWHCSTVGLVAFWIDVAIKTYKWISNYAKVWNLLQSLSSKFNNLKVWVVTTLASVEVKHCWSLEEYIWKGLVIGQTKIKWSLIVPKQRTLLFKELQV